jgi:hypothetical protein
MKMMSKKKKRNKGIGIGGMKRRVRAHEEGIETIKGKTKEKEDTLIEFL